MDSPVDGARVLSFLQERAAHRSLVLFLGAGVSRDAGLPTWDDLMAPLAEELGLQTRIDPLDVAEYYIESGDERRAQLYRMLRQRLRSAGHGGGHSRPARPGALHRALARIPAPVIFTTNFDQLMEDAIGEERGVPPDVVLRDADVGRIDESHGVTLVKLHGCISLPNTIVLSRGDVEAYGDAHRAMIAYLQALLATRTFLFVGFSLVDPNFRLIYRAIREAIGPDGRPAYALMQGQEMTPLLQGWVRRGVQPILFPDFPAIRAYVEEIADGSRSTPALPELEPQLEGMRETVRGIIRQVAAEATEAGGEAEAEASLRQEETGPAPSTDEGASVRELLDLVGALDRLSALDPATWCALGDLAYRRRDLAAAIRAYPRALRPLDDGEGLDERHVLRLRGNLARALAQQGHHARAEWLLRRCVFLPGKEMPAEGWDEAQLAARLHTAQLERRPDDAFELAYSVTRRAEALRLGGHAAEMFEGVREVRAVLETLLHLPLSFTEDGWLAQAVRGPDNPAPARPPEDGRAMLRALYLNYLGKCYRLSCMLALDMQADSDEVGRYLRRALHCLRLASVVMPLLPYPYGHRLHLAREQRLPRAERETIQQQVLDELQRLPRDSSETQDLIDGLRAAFPDLAPHLLRGHV